MMRIRCFFRLTMFKHTVLIFSLFLFVAGCKERKESEDSVSVGSQATQPDFGNDVEFLKKYTDIILLEDSSGKGKIAVSPALQGRVMTSTSDGDAGLSYGWI